VTSPQKGKNWTILFYFPIYYTIIMEIFLILYLSYGILLCPLHFVLCIISRFFIASYTECPKNGVLTVHYGVEEITVNVRKMLKKFYWTYLLICRSLKVALNRSIISKYVHICTY
jgi:hypothetical protein